MIDRKMDMPLERLYQDPLLNAPTELSLQSVLYGHIRAALGHLAIISLVPALCLYFSLAHLGWQVSATHSVYLNETTALALGGLLYLLLLVATLSMGGISYLLTRHQSRPITLANIIELTIYAATPALLVGFLMLYPEVWFMSIAWVVAISYSAFLFYKATRLHLVLSHKRSLTLAGLMMMLAVAILVLFNLLLTTMVLPLPGM